MASYKAPILEDLDVASILNISPELVGDNKLVRWSGWIDNPNSWNYSSTLEVHGKEISISVLLPDMSVSVSRSKETMKVPSSKITDYIVRPNDFESREMIREAFDVLLELGRTIDTVVR